MSAAAFDTHKYAKRLMDAGVTPAHADVQAETMGCMMAELAANTCVLEKHELRNAAQIDVFGARLDKAVAELSQKISETSQNSMRWTLSIGVAFGLIQTSALVLIIFKLV
ncbi:hypothetical protein [Pseudoduganella violacea]|uniref:DUF1640 domain-containing protein n=1 Tax=Pseudoduganella violacea TaxID=1715466 RepID=A0A7W5BBC4_9BURK|nr:hypothetical protein [Pseudoduganella violacea]MBB3119665.1 hypothetical protein [Pseudoduganella violacea]